MLEIISKIFHNSLRRRQQSQYTILKKKAIGKGDDMDPKLVKQFILFLVVLFGWTAIILIVGPK
jgi:hypothetical protein